MQELFVYSNGYLGAAVKREVSITRFWERPERISDHQRWRDISLGPTFPFRDLAAPGGQTHLVPSQWRADEDSVDSRSISCMLSNATAWNVVLGRGVVCNAAAVGARSGLRRSSRKRPRTWVLAYT